MFANIFLLVLLGSFFSSILSIYRDVVARQRLERDQEMLRQNILRGPCSSLRPQRVATKKRSAAGMTERPMPVVVRAPEPSGGVYAHSIKPKRPQGLRGGHGNSVQLLRGSSEEIQSETVARKRYSAEFTVKVELDAIGEAPTLAELSTKPSMSHITSSEAKVPMEPKPTVH